jgi:hypothetical protein
MSAFILANSKFVDDENYLALVHPHGFARWKESTVMSFMASTDGGFKEVFSLVEKMNSQQVKYIKEKMKPLRFDEAYVGSDVNVADQLLLSALGMNHFYRLDDGMWSYYNEDRKRPFHKAKFHELQIKLAACTFGISSDFPINTIALGENKAGLGDYLFMPELLKRKSPKVFDIDSDMIQTAMDKLAKRNLLEQELFDYDYLVYLSQPIIPDAVEKNYLADLMKNLPENKKVIYKPHPNEKDEKIDYVKKNYPEIIINDSKLPIEIILTKEPCIKEVVSYQTTTLIIAKKVTGRDIKCISLANPNGKNKDNAYIGLMKETGVEFV